MSVESLMTNHVHLFDFTHNTWQSTYNSSSPHVAATSQLAKFKIPRTNHACTMFRENGKSKVMIAGGVIEENGVYKTTRTVEILDLDTWTWTFGHPLPSSVTGSKLLIVYGRPLLIGR